MAMAGVTRHRWAALAVVLLGLGCAPGPEMARAVGTATPGREAAARGACPVTLPVPREAIPPAAAAAILAGSSAPPGALRLSVVGNNALWVVIPVDGRVVGVRRPDGVFDKFPTVRLVEGRVTGEARRLDAPAPPAQVSIPEGYGGSGFQAVGVTFPTGGCWEVTERVAGQELRIVVAVAAPAP